MPSLKELRQRRLLSVRDLARAANVATETIISCEAGRRYPRPATMAKIAAALGVAVDEVDEFARSTRYWFEEFEPPRKRDESK